MTWPGILHNPFRVVFYLVVRGDAEDRQVYAFLFSGRQIRHESERGRACRVLIVDAKYNGTALIEKVNQIGVRSPSTQPNTVRGRRFRRFWYGPFGNTLSPIIWGACSDSIAMNRTVRL